MTGLPHGSLTEHECGRALQGYPPRKYAQAVEIERTRATGGLSEHNGLLPEGFDFTGRIWTLPELEVATACRFRWFTIFALGVQQRNAVWDDLRRAALRAATEALHAGHDPLVQAERALRMTATRLRAHGSWHPGALWESQIIELLRKVERVLALPDFLPAGWRPESAGYERTFRTTTGGHTFRLRLEIDRLDHAPTGLILTTYRQMRPLSGTALTHDAQLALLLEASGAVAARTLDLQSCKFSGLQYRVMRPTHESPITLARQTLAELGNALTDGQVGAQPEAGRCHHCPVRSLCRAADGGEGA